MEADFQHERWVRIMCHMLADGVWHKDGSAGVSDDLPISSKLKKHIRAWQDWYDQRAPQIPEDNPNLFDVRAFSAEGLAIAKAIKAELSDWTVIYHDEEKVSRTQWQNTAELEARRPFFEYEV